MILTLRITSAVTAHPLEEKNKMKPGDNSAGLQLLGMCSVARDAMRRAILSLLRPDTCIERRFITQKLLL
jgi:hypothetical protein